MLTPERLAEIRARCNATGDLIDRRFAAAYHLDIPDLLDEVERLSKENAERCRKLDRATGLAGMA